ncbi:hypothetical protein [Pseudactinotalea sp.]|uniref:hypothetical protein n=1 Tax=Pseudactinotalea sp. TaxID=1926260 RepID=UPI003B3BC3F8
MSTADENAATEPYVCEHCDDSVPHQHVDEQPLVEAYRRDLLRSTLAVCGVGVAALAVVSLLTWRTWGAPTAGFHGAAAWLVATGIGLVVFLVMRRSATATTGVIGGAIATAAVSPILALLVAWLVPGPIGLRGLTAALGWLVPSLLVTSVRSGRLRDTLKAHTRAGEAARSAVVRTGGRPSPYVEAAWLVATAVVFGLCVALTAIMPIATGVLVPLNAALAMLSRRLQARAAGNTDTPAPRS